MAHERPCHIFAYQHRKVIKADTAIIIVDIEAAAGTLLSITTSTVRDRSMGQAVGGPQSPTTWRAAFTPCLPYNPFHHECPRPTIRTGPVRRGSNRHR